MLKKYKVNSKKLDADTRKSLGKDFADLPVGNTHYKIEGDGSEWFVLVHGYATPLFIYDKIAEGLVKNGYKVLRYDLLGRGLSERVPGDYNLELFVRQLEEICDKFIPEGKFHLVGTSMGGVITAAYTAKNPHRVKSWLLMAPAGMIYDVPLYMKLANIKGIGEIMFYTVGGGILTKGSAKEIIYSGETVCSWYMDQFALHLEYEGMMKATLSSLRKTLLKFDETVAAYKKAAEHKIPTLVIWGTEDKTMPYYQAERMQKIMPGMELVTYKGSGHIFVFDEGERTVSDILDFINKLPL